MGLDLFIKDFKKQIRNLTGKVLSSERLAGLLGVNAERLRGWEKGALPNSDEDRMKIKVFFRLQNLDNIPNDALQSAIVVNNDLGDRLWIGSDVYQDLITKALANENPAFQVKEGKRKEVKVLGKMAHNKLNPDEYKDAFENWPGLPMYNVPITASFVELYRDEKEYQTEYHLFDPRFRDCDFGAMVRGDSMHDEIRHGDFIVCKEILDYRFLVYGDIYYVVSTNGLETCKYINEDPKDSNNLLLVAKNTKISSSPLPKDMILRIFKVRGIVRAY